jgi:hypothetical protein
MAELAISLHFGSALLVCASCYGTGLLNRAISGCMLLASCRTCWDTLVCCLVAGKGMVSSLQQGCLLLAQPGPVLMLGPGLKVALGELV